MSMVKEEWLERENKIHNDYEEEMHKVYDQRENLWENCPCEYCKMRRKETRT